MSKYFLDYCLLNNHLVRCFLLQLQQDFYWRDMTSCLHCSCYSECVQGVCSGEPAYECVCDIGWTSVDCSVDCGCNNHSTCLDGIQQCDECLHWTSGLSCDCCASGSYGSATSPSVGQFVSQSSVLLSVKLVSVYDTCESVGNNSSMSARSTLLLPVLTSYQT